MTCDRRWPAASSWLLRGPCLSNLHCRRGIQGTIDRPRAATVFSLASYNSKSNSNTNCGSDSLRHKRQHQPQSNGSRAMKKVPAPGPGVQDKYGQKTHPLSLCATLTQSFSMTAKHGESAPILQPSYFTPPVPTMTQEPAAAAGGKKRNKLGYDRRSIACSKYGPLRRPYDSWLAGRPRGRSGQLEHCSSTTTNKGCDTIGHCRRRKIRCIVSPEIQNRCISCIRLKKDCSFCPVGQLPTVDSQGKPAGPGTGSSTANSQSSSSALAVRQPIRMAPRSMYGTGPRQDSNGHATSAIVPPSVEYTSVTGEGLPTRRVGSLGVWTDFTDNFGN